MGLAHICPVFFVSVTMVQKSPTLDPLLASLVSAFIITAVIIILLLLLKLRRRQNRPEFHRLQDLPMVSTAWHSGIYCSPVTENIHLFSLDGTTSSLHIL